jgi:hypothetical protein
LKDREVVKTLLESYVMKFGDFGDEEIERQALKLIARLDREEGMAGSIPNFLKAELPVDYVSKAVDKSLREDIKNSVAKGMGVLDRKVAKTFGASINELESDD